MLSVLVWVLVMTPVSDAAIPPFASTYAGTAVNETHGIETTMELTEVKEGPTGAISGQVIWGPGLIGNGPFEGTVKSDGSVVLLIPHPVGFNKIELTGEAAPAGDMHGHYVVEPGTQVGRWEVSPKLNPVSAPTVMIVGHPLRETLETTASFTFSGVSGGAYECSIDAGAWRPCVSGESFAPFPPGDHGFQVRETLNGLTGPAASYSWTVDLPRACILKVARARVFAFTHQSKARLLIHYKAYKPARVTVSYDLKGKRGSLSLGTASSHFTTAGVYRLPEALSGSETRKLRAATGMTVRFAIPDAPDSCHRYYTKRLTIPKKVFGQTVWFQSDSIFGSEAK
jgi:hypothetical protein